MSENSIEEALTALVGIDIPDRKMEKGIPFVSSVVKEREGAVFMKPLPLFDADSSMEKLAAGSELLYRADYLRGGRKFATGILEIGKNPGTFLKTLGNNISSGNGKADPMGIYSYLEAHLALCGLERLAQEEIAFMGEKEAGTKDYREAGSAYYKEVLAYVEMGRRYLNAAPSGILLPPFPQRGAFMVRWCREHRDSQET